MDRKLSWIELGLGLIWWAEPVKKCHGVEPHRITNPQPQDLSSPILPSTESRECELQRVKPPWPPLYFHLSLLLSCPPPWTLTALVPLVVPSNPFSFTAQSFSLLPNSEWGLSCRHPVTVVAPAAHQRWKVYTPNFSENVDSCCDEFLL